jgi:hypothetical protein
MFVNVVTIKLDHMHVVDSMRMQLRYIISGNHAPFADETMPRCITDIVTGNTSFTLSGRA